MRRQRFSDVLVPTVSLFSGKNMNNLLMSLRLLAVQPDQGNNLYLAEREIRDFMEITPPGDVKSTLESIKTKVDDLMRSDERTSKLLTSVNEFLDAQINRGSA
jgi:hypothetical protein